MPQKHHDAKAHAHWCTEMPMKALPPVLLIVMWEAAWMVIYSKVKASATNERRNSEMAINLGELESAANTCKVE